VRGSGLGILREREGTTVSTSFATLPPETRARARLPEILVLSKANTRATVHRPGYLDYVGVKRFDDQGQVVGERRFLGLYTHNVYTANLDEIPVVRRKVAQVLQRAGFRPASHNGKALSSILEDYPRFPLVQFNLGCVLEQLGDTEASIERLHRAIQLAPHLADAHLNLALAYQKRGETEAARLHLSRYLQYEPQGPWAEYARQYVQSRQFRSEAPPGKRGGRMGKVTPFRRW